MLVNRHLFCCDMFKFIDVENYYSSVCSIFFEIGVRSDKMSHMHMLLYINEFSAL